MQKKVNSRWPRMGRALVGNPMLLAVWIVFSAFPSHSLQLVIAQPDLRNVCQMVLPFVSLLPFVLFPLACHPISPDQAF